MWQTPILLAACLLPLSAAVVEVAELRLRLQAQITQLSAGFAADEAGCQHRFAVTSCTEEVRSRRRDTLSPLRSQLLALDEAERGERASARLQAIASKRQAQGASVPETLPARRVVERASLAAPAPLIVLRRDEAAAGRQQAASVAAAQRAAAYQRRLQQVEANAARVRERVAERGRGGDRAAPLPVPAR